MGGGPAAAARAALTHLATGQAEILRSGTESGARSGDPAARPGAASGPVAISGLPGSAAGFPGFMAQTRAVRTALAQAAGLTTALRRRGGTESPGATGDGGGALRPGSAGDGPVAPARGAGVSGALAGRPPHGPDVHNPQPAADLRVLGGAGLPPGNEPDPTGAVTVGPAGPSGPGVPGSPRERWEAAVAARPLEAPRALPSALQSMAAAISGRARAPLFTTGPATRHALAAAGALGATTGTVVHLPVAPEDRAVMPHVLAHELTHTRSPVRRPRFLLDGASGLLDDDERQALDAGRRAVTQAGTAASRSGATAMQTGAGIVDQLPVGGGIGAVGDVAQRAARAAVLEATASPLGGAAGAFGGMAAGASGTFGAMSEPVTNAAADPSGDPAGGVSTAGGGTAGGGTAGGATAGGGAGTAGGAGPAAKQALDPDKIMEVVEQRLLREIERRGGRWAGVF